MLKLIIKIAYTNLEIFVGQITNHLVKVFLIFLVDESIMENSQGLVSKQVEYLPLFWMIVKITKLMIL